MSPLHTPSQPSAGKELLNHTQLDNATAQDATVASTAYSDIAGATISFEAPESGKVLVSQCATQYSSAAGSAGMWAMRDNTSSVTVAETEAIIGNNTGAFRFTSRSVVSGLTPGQVYVWKWSHRRDGGSGTIHHLYGGPAAGIRYGPAIMEVWSI